MYDRFIEERSEFGMVLSEDHASVLTALEDLLFDETSGPERLRSSWRMIEAGLYFQLALEEELLIPRFELVRPADAARVRGEHRQIREQLAHLESQFERGVVDRQRIARLLGILRVSSVSKERGLYAWAEDALRPRDKARLVGAMLGHRASRAPSAAPRPAPWPERAQQTSSVEA